MKEQKEKGGQLSEELKRLRKRVAELEQAETVGVEEKLQESEGKYRNLFENARDVIVTFDLKGNVTAINKAVAVYGFKEDEFAGKNMLKFVSKKYWPRLLQELAKIAQGDPVEGEIELITPKGEIIAEYRSNPIRRGERIVGFQTILRDITERKQTEEEIRKLSQYLESVIDNASVWLNVLDEKRNVVIWNKAAEEISGYPREEVIGDRKIWEWLYPDAAYRKKVFRKAAVVRKRGKLSEDIETIIRCKDGRSKILSRNSQNLLDAEGNLVGSIAISLDITGQKQVEGALRENEEKYRSLVEFTEDSVYLLDKTRTFLFINNKYLSRLDLPIDKVIGRSYDEFHSEEKTKEFAKKIEQVLKTSGSVQYEHKSERDNHYFLRTLSPVKDRDGQITAVTVISKDVTERKRAEGALRERANQLETIGKVGRSLSSFLNLDELLSHVVKAIQQSFGYYHVDIFLVDQDYAFFKASSNPVVEERWKERGRRFKVGEEGMIGWVAQSGEPLLANDISQEPHYIPDKLLPETKSELTIPLKLEEQTAGILDVQSNEHNAFNDDDVFVLQTLADQITVALDNARLYEAVRKELAERKRAERLLQALDHAAVAMGKAPTSEEVFTAVTKELKKLGFSCAVLLTDESQKRLLPKYLSYEAKAIKAAEKLVGFKAEDLSIPVETVEVYSKVIQTRKTVFVENAEEVVRQLLPGPAKRLAKQIAKMLKVSKSVDAPLIVEDEVIGLLLVQSDDLTEDDMPAITAFAHQMVAAWRKAKLLQALQRSLAEREQAQKELKRTAETLRKTLETTIQAMASAVEMRDPYTAGHQRRVAELACAIANEMGLSEEQIEGLRMAGLIHDIGKINVPAEILSKPGPLNTTEFALIKTHPQVGHDILKEIDFPWPVADIILQHHERMDGSGYPNALKGDEILIEARILAVADVVEAMSSRRPYREALGVDKALKEVEKNRGKSYDPQVVDACLRLFAEGFELKRGQADS